MALTYSTGQFPWCTYLYYDGFQVTNRMSLSTELGSERTISLPSEQELLPTHHWIQILIQGHFSGHRGGEDGLQKTKRLS